MIANIVVNLFVASKPVSIKDYNIQAEYPPDSEMDSLGYYPKPINGYSVEEMQAIAADYQLDVQYNGDIIIYTLDESAVRQYVGTHKYGAKCDLLEMVIKHLIAND